MPKKSKFATPAEVYGQLFIAMHESGIWKDGKTISDIIPKFKPATILKNYAKEKGPKPILLFRKQAIANSRVILPNLLKHISIPFGKSSRGEGIRR